MNTCGQMGVAVGAAAHLCKKYSTTPRGAYRDHLPELLGILHREGASGAEQGAAAPKAPTADPRRHRPEPGGQPVRPPAAR
jgi:hypothetical protein